MTNKIAFITGITGQDGAYLAEFLLGKNYTVHGLQRRASTPNTMRLSRLLKDAENSDGSLYLHFGDLTDTTNILRLLGQIRPTEIYNLGAQSHVAVSFEMPEYTANANALGTIRLLEAIRTLGLTKETRFYQASTSELFGASPPPHNESTPFKPRSPYAAAKLYAYWVTVNYREAYGLHASNGILFNHEGPTRGETFVSRKISQAVAKISLGLQSVLELGNLDATRDWGHALDYVEGMWMMLQQPNPDDYVLATGETHMVREFVELAFEAIDQPIRWQGEGIDTQGVDANSGNVLVRVNPAFFRPTDVTDLRGDPSKARAKLGWKHRTSFRDLVLEMVESDIAALREVGAPGAD